jgi:hypothetical protein
LTLFHAARIARQRRGAFVASKPANSTEDNGRPRGYIDQAGAAAYVGYSLDQFRDLIARGIFPRGRPLTADGKLLFRISDLDAAVEKAWRSRKPRREARGVVRQRLEAKRRREQQESKDSSLTRTVRTPR